MPNYYFREFWTPLKLIGIRFYRDDEYDLWVKFWNRPKQLIK